MLDPELWQGYRAVMRSFVRIPAWREWLDANRDKVTEHLFTELAAQEPGPRTSPASA